MLDPILIHHVVALSDLLCRRFIEALSAVANSVQERRVHTRCSIRAWVLILNWEGSAGWGLEA